MVKDEHCENGLFWQSDIEDAVMKEIFGLSYLPDETHKKSNALIDPADALNQQIVSLKKKLSRLLDFEDDMEDDVLTEKIHDCRKKIRELEAQLKSENEHKNIIRKVKRARMILTNLKESWEHMSPKERQSVCRELIERVVIRKDGQVEVFLRLRNYLSVARG